MTTQRNALRPKNRDTTIQTLQVGEGETERKQRIYIGGMLWSTVSPAAFRMSKSVQPPLTSPTMSWYSFLRMKDLFGCHLGFQQQQVVRVGAPRISWMVLPEKRSISDTPLLPQQTATILWEKDRAVGISTSVTGWEYRMWDAIEKRSTSQI